VPIGDNYYTALNSAVFSDGSFVYVPKGVRSPMELSTYFRINAQETGQVGGRGTCVCGRGGARGTFAGVWLPVTPTMKWMGC
jgi:Fe-S cluster assembly scaffold protein SufB